MDYDLFDLATLADVYRRVKVSPSYWLDTYFNRQINFEGKKIIFERVYGDDRKLAPFVVPNVSGRPQRLSGYEALDFSPAYSKQKDVVDYTMHIERQVGEALGGSLTIAQRRDAVVAELIRLQKVKMQNTWNWMAARALIDGKVLISGEDYPATLVDFRRDADLTSVLTTGARWTEPTADPLADLRERRVLANGLSGARIARYVFGGNAWELFSQRVDLRELMRAEYAGRGQNTQVNLMREGFGDTVEYMGTMSGANGQGRMEFFVDTSRFVSPETGLEEFHLDQNTVVGISPDVVGGTRCFAAIMDKAANFKPLPMFFKNWEEQDPSQEYLLTQSAPLMVPREPNATFSIKVADDE